ncbi:MAG: hypothetical protein ACTSRG_09315 [Candidatus Helarchaeota archaeon]
MGKQKFFKCPKCGNLLQVKIDLPEDNESWPFILHYRHMSPDNQPCDIVLAIDPNYSIREIGKEGMEEQKAVSGENTTEDKKMEDLGFKIIRE